MKKILFTVSLLAATTAFAIFIPLQKDGSVRWTNNDQGYATIEGLVPSSAPSGERKPAANNNPDAYVPPPEEKPYTPPPVVEEPPPVYTQPEEPTYSGNYSCLKEGFKRAGYRKTSQGYINMVVAASKIKYDNAVTGKILFWGGKVDPQKNYQSGLRNSIFVLASLGNCSDYPNVGGDLLNHTPSVDEYASTFKLSPNAISKGYVAPWNPTGQAQISSTFNHYARKTNGQIYNCTKVKESQTVSAELCKALIKACGVGNPRDCNYVEPHDNDHGDHGNHNGHDTGGSDTGHTTDGGQHETPNGEHDNNNDHGYGNDGSNGGPGQGNGPPGS